MKRISTIFAGTLLSVLLCGSVQARSFNPLSTAELAQSSDIKTDSTTLLKKGDKAVDFSVSCFDGATRKLSAYKGKVVLLTFWGSWCPPCLAELAPEQLPAKVLNQFKGNKDFVFFPVSVSEDKERLTAYFNSERGKPRVGYLGATGIDTNRDNFKLYATQGVPRSVVIGRDGKIVFTSVGFIPNSDELQHLADAIKAALEAK